MEIAYKLAGSDAEIKNWVESHGGKPAIIDDVEVTQDETGLRINWEGKRDELMLSKGRETTKDISWEEFFSIMKRKDLIFLYSDSEEVDQTLSYKFSNKYKER
jgi:hypothetical protein